MPLIIDSISDVLSGRFRLSTNAEFDKNRRLLKAIEIVIQSPEFQQKWNDFTTILAELIGSMVDKIRQELDGEFGEMIGDITELVYKNSKTALLLPITLCSPIFC